MRHASTALWASLMLDLSAMAALGQAPALDYAEPRNASAWLRHAVYGDVSYDSFERAAKNPVVRGAPPHEWPVNGCLFRDPQGGAWFLYVGEYPSGYAFTPALPMRCIIWRSDDQGRNWRKLGPAFPGPGHLYEGQTSPAVHAPDVHVIQADGRYHMVFDWCTASTTWQNASNPTGDADSGVGYAWAERPEGPWQITPRPLATTKAQQPLLGKYRRLYISSIVRRANDWLVLTNSDSGPHFGWALLGMTAPQPEGPYTPAKLLLHPQSPRFHPPLVEFNPGFTHEGFVYMPATSVGANRDCQAMFRAAIERAHEPDGWELAQLGSLWHSEPVEHEFAGLWGQTFSGFVAPDGRFNVFFPSRDSQNRGTVNIASRPWDEPSRQRGFVISGHEAPSLCYLRKGGRLTSVEVQARVTGTVSVVWKESALLATDPSRWPFWMHPMCTRNYSGLELTTAGWAIVRVDVAGRRTAIAEGQRGVDAPLTLKWEGSQARIMSGEKELWRGECLPGQGAIALLAAPRSHARVDRLIIGGELTPTAITYMYTEGVVGAAQRLDDWPVATSPHVRHGLFAVCKPGPGVEAKVNFEGSRAQLWAPTGPDYGSATLLLDGRSIGTISFGPCAEQPSRVLREFRDLTPGGHGLTIRPSSGKPIPLDCLEAWSE